MNSEEVVGKNFAWVVFSQMVTRIFGLAFFVFMSYVLLEKGMGQYNFIVSFVAFWFIFSDFGISSYMYREWSRGSEDHNQIKNDFNLVLTIKLLMCAVIFIPFAFVNWFVNKDIFVPSVLYFIFVVLSLVISQMEVYLNSVNVFKYGAIRTLIEKLTTILFGGVLLLFFHNVVSVFIGMIVSQIFALAYYLKGRFPFFPSFRLDWLRFKFLAIRGLPFAFFTIFVSIYGRIDMVMLKYMKSFEAVGWYSAGYKAYELANVFPGVLFLPVIFPVLSRIYHSEGRDKFKEFFDRSIRILFSTSLLLTIFFVFAAPYLVGIFFPASFTASILVMRIIVLVLVISSLSSLFYNLIIIQNNEKVSLKIIIASCFANVILNLILIPKYSLYGAAWATVIAEGFNLFLLQHYTDWVKDKSMLLKIGLVMLFCASSLILFRYFGLTNNIILGAIFILVNTGLLWFLNLIQKGDLQMFYLPIKNKIQMMFFNQDEI